MKQNLKIFYRASFIAAASLAALFAAEAVRLWAEYQNASGANSAPFWLYILPPCMGYGAGAAVCGILGIVFWRKAKRKSEE